RARAGDPRCCRLYARGPGPGSSSGREPAQARRHPPRPGFGHRQTHGHARFARGALHQGSRSRIGRAVSAAAALSQLVTARAAFTMEHLNYRFTGGTRVASSAPQLVGVVGSGNLEVLIEPAAQDGACTIEVVTASMGFGKVWEAVIADF